METKVAMATKFQWQLRSNGNKISNGNYVPMATKVCTKSTIRTKCSPRGFGFICNMCLFSLKVDIFSLKQICIWSGKKTHKQCKKPALWLATVLQFQLTMVCTLLFFETLIHFLFTAKVNEKGQHLCCRDEMEFWSIQRGLNLEITKPHKSSYTLCFKGN